jgi:hypothetical protein
MTRNRDDRANSFETDDSGGWLSRWLADEDEFDRRAMWRLGSWAVGSVGALVLAILATQSSTQTKREQVAAADLARQSQLIQRVAKEAQAETGRLASAIDTLNGDRDRLFSRLGSLEQGLDSVTGSLAQPKTPAPPPAAPDKPAVAAQPSAGPTQPSTPLAAVAAPPIAPVEAKPATATPADSKPAAMAPVEAKPVAAVPVEPKSISTASTALTAPPVESKPAEATPAGSAVVPEAPSPRIKPAPDQPVAVTAPAAPLMPAKSFMAPPDPAAAKLLEPPSTVARTAVTAPEPEEVDSAAPAIPVQRTEFGVDLGGANSIDGLRSLWQRLLKSNKVLEALRPIIMVKERPGGGTHLRLVAGPLNDAATAAKFCAILSGSDRFCETSVFDGQRLATGGPASSSKPSRKRGGNAPKVTSAQEPEPEPKSPSLMSFHGPR